MEDIGGDTHDGLLIQNRPLQVPLLPELSCHQQSDLKGTQKASAGGLSACSDTVLRSCQDGRGPQPSVSQTLVAQLLRLHCCGAQQRSSLLQGGGSSWAPELGSCPRLTLQTSGAASLSQAPLRCNPMGTGKTSGDPHDSDLALDFPGLGDGRQVTRRHHHGPVGKWSSRCAQPGLPPCPTPARPGVSGGTEPSASVCSSGRPTLCTTPALPCHPRPPGMSQQVFPGGP